MQYAACLDTCSCCHDKDGRRAQFDSDYSGGDGASFLLFLQVSLVIIPIPKEE